MSLLPPEDPDLTSKVSIYIISRNRSQNVPLMQAHLPNHSVTWVIRPSEKSTYLASGATHTLPGGTLAQSRNAALSHAFSLNKTCVQLDDDLIRARWWTLHGWNREDISVAQAISAVLKVLDETGYYLGGGMPTDYLRHRGGTKIPGAGGRQIQPVYNTLNFIASCFIVVRPSELRFSEDLVLKEDYDFTVRHIKEYGGVARLCRLNLKFKVGKNEGGAVEYRTKELEKSMIERIRGVHPGWFRRGRNESQFVLVAPRGFRGVKEKGRVKQLRMLSADGERVQGWEGLIGKIGEDEVEVEEGEETE